MKTHKIDFKTMLTIICIITLVLCLTACDGCLDCEYGIIIAKGEQMDYYIDGEQGNGIHPIFVGYYVQVLKCDENGELILDENGKEQISVYRTTDENEFYKYYSGDIVEFNEKWSKFS